MLSFKTGFFEGFQNSAGSVGENKPFGGTKGKMLAVCGVLLPHPLLRPWAQAQTTSTSASQHLLSCLITQPGCQDNVLLGMKGRQKRSLFSFLIFTTQNIKSPRSGVTIWTELSRKPGQLETARWLMNDSSVSPAAATQGRNTRTGREQTACLLTAGFLCFYFVVFTYIYT